MKCRDNFTNKTTTILAKRAGFQCSNPGCKQPTVGPGQSDNSEVIHIGVAAHITAASEGGPRFDSSLTSGERKAIENAIHLCQNCAKLIDANDGKDYPIEMLNEWKKSHEANVRERIRNPAASRKQGITLLQPKVNMIEAKEKWDQLLGIFSSPRAKTLAKQITDPRRASNQKDCPDIKKYVDAKFKAVGGFLQEPYAKEVNLVFERAKKILNQCITDKEMEPFLSDWVEAGETLTSLGYFQ